MPAPQSVACNGSSPERGGLRRPPRMLLLVELAVLALMVATPIALKERPELITLITNIVILSLLAISFDLCWGFSGIMGSDQRIQRRDECPPRVKLGPRGVRWAL